MTLGVAEYLLLVRPSAIVSVSPHLSLSSLDWNLMKDELGRCTSRDWAAAGHVIRAPGDSAAEANGDDLCGTMSPAREARGRIAGMRGVLRRFPRGDSLV